MEKLDEIDRKIIEYLLKDSRVKLVDLARILNIPLSTLHNRIKRLEKIGVIKKYSVKVDYRKLGYLIKALILIKYDSTSKLDQYTLLNNLLKEKNVTKGFIITGEWDLLIECIFRNTDEMANFILKKLRNMKGVKESFTMVVLEEKDGG